MTPPGRTIAIMQPTYLPWVGYLDLIDRSDRFVFLDSVQFAKRSWQQRNRVKKLGADPIQWLTVPVLTKGRRDQTIREAEIDRSSGFAEAHLKTIRHLYAKAPFFEDHFVALAAILPAHDRLAQLNFALISWICAALEIKTEVFRSSELAADGARADLLANICLELGADHYLSAAGSKAYIDVYDPFTPKGITLEYQAYMPVPYRQLHGAFEPYLSVIDLLFNEGPESLGLIRAGRARQALLDAAVEPR